MILFSISGLTPFCQAPVEGRRHDVERHEQRQADEDEIGGRRLQPEPGAQEGERDHEAREAGDHHQEAGRHRQHGDDQDELDDAAGSSAVAGRHERFEARQLRLGGRHGRHQQKCQEKGAQFFHSTTSD